MSKDKKIKVLVVGSNGLVGSSVVRVLNDTNNNYEIIASTRDDTDLFNVEQTKNLIETSRPDILIIAAARVGGIVANNTKRTEFILENLKINMNLLESCIPYPQIKIINLGSSCIYPLEANDPISEDSFMTGKLEPTNSPYAMAKIAAIEIGRSLNTQFKHNVINLMPTNLYGPNDFYSKTDSHVIPGLIYRMHEAKLEDVEKFNIWGTGTPLREFLYVDDLALAIKFVIENEVNIDLLNIGSGEEISIKELAEKIQTVVGYKGSLQFDESKPDGNPRKLLDSSKINELGWKSTTNLDEGLKKSYDWFSKNIT
ncbi:MAG: GDP-L-fucose synthase [Thermodesulfobacteriota bacterium]|nr:GDP-L-fucose synthase [Thermodesulfobacteriota bacterium]|tara:strand:- start:53 stop:991 length:939 start_codon:yes stop_codon:yes gene_type:complete